MNIVGAAERKLAQVEAKLIEFKPRSTPEPKIMPMAATPVAPIATGHPQAADMTSEQKQAIEKLLQRAEALTQQLRSAVTAADAASKASDNKIDLLQQRVHEASISHNQLTGLVREANTTSTQLDSLQSQARQAKGMLMDAINAAASRIDELLEQAGSATQSAESVAPLLQQTHTRTQESLRELRATAQTAQVIASQSQELMGRLTQLVDQLRPWEGMLEERGDGQLPPALAAMVEQARREVASEASAVAGALRDAAMRMSSRV
jgi:ABC-type transporter Mla subunit MlaD